MTATPQRDKQDDSDGTAETTPINYRNSDSDFILDTPNGRNSGELICPRTSLMVHLVHNELTLYLNSKKLKREGERD